MFRGLLRGLWPRKEVPKHPVVRASKEDDGSYDIQLAIRCLIYLDDASKQWIAQGLDLDYVASAPSREDAMQEFQEGLVATIKSYLDEFGSIDAFVRPAPEHIWKDFYAELLKQEPVEDKVLSRNISNGMRARVGGGLSFFSPPNTPVAHAH